MGDGVKKGLKAVGIRSYAEAEAACVYLRTLRAASGATYQVDDLACFLCSITHKEAAHSLSLPDAASPVSIELDLGLLPQVSRPNSTRIWTRSQPLVRIRRKTKQDATMSSILISVLPELLAWVSNFGASSLCHSSRAFHGGGLYMARRKRQRKQNIARLIAGLLYSKLPAFLPHGVGAAQLLRTQACACDWIDSCDGVLGDDRAVALALLRLCAKFELRAECRDIVLKHIGAGTETGVVDSLEFSLMRSLRIRSEPMAIDDMIQLLASDPHLIDDRYTIGPSGTIA